MRFKRGTMFFLYFHVYRVQWFFSSVFVVLLGCTKTFEHGLGKILCDGAKGCIKTINVKCSLRVN